MTDTQENELGILSCCLKGKKVLLDLRNSCSHAALNGQGVSLPKIEYCPWCGAKDCKPPQTLKGLVVSSIKKFFFKGENPAKGFNGRSRIAFRIIACSTFISIALAFLFAICGIGELFSTVFWFIEVVGLCITGIYITVTDKDGY